MAKILDGDEINELLNMKTGSDVAKIYFNYFTNELNYFRILYLRKIKNIIRLYNNYYSNNERLLYEIILKYSMEYGSIIDKLQFSSTFLENHTYHPIYEENKEYFNRLIPNNEISYLNIGLKLLYDIKHKKYFNMDRMQYHIYMSDIFKFYLIKITSIFITYELSYHFFRKYIDECKNTKNIKNIQENIRYLKFNFRKDINRIIYIK